MIYQYIQKECLRISISQIFFLKRQSPMKRNFFGLYFQFSAVSRAQHQPNLARSARGVDLGDMRCTNRSRQFRMKVQLIRLLLATMSFEFGCVFIFLPIANFCKNPSSVFLNIVHEVGTIGAQKCQLDYLEKSVFWKIPKKGQKRLKTGILDF